MTTEGTVHRYGSPEREQEILETLIALLAQCDELLHDLEQYDPKYDELIRTTRAAGERGYTDYPVLVNPGLHGPRRGFSEGSSRASGPCRHRTACARRDAIGTAFEKPRGENATCPYRPFSNRGKVDGEDRCPNPLHLPSDGQGHPRPFRALRVRDGRAPKARVLTCTSD